MVSETFTVSYFERLANLLITLAIPFGITLALMNGRRIDQMWFNICAEVPNTPNPVCSFVSLALLWYAIIR